MRLVRQSSTTWGQCHLDVGINFNDCSIDNADIFHLHFGGHPKFPEDVGENSLQLERGILCPM